MGLIIAAAITTAIVLGAFAVLLWRSENRGATLLAFAVALPLQPLALILVRQPIAGLLQLTFGTAGWLIIVAQFYAPLTEEPAKWLVAAVPPVHRAIHMAPVGLALAVGLGFGIGEIWLIAYALLRLPSYPDFPFYMFNPFIIERLEVCFLHGAFVSLPFVAMACKRPFILGGIAGMVLHFALNFPIYLAQIDAFGLGGATWTSVLLLWPPVMVVACAVMVWRLARCVPGPAKDAA